MTLLTLFPPTFAVDKPMGGGGVNGRNNALGAKYWRYHPHAAAVAAQEVREARMQAIVLFGCITAGIAAGGAAHWLHPLFSPLWASMLAGALLSFAPYAVYSMASKARSANINLTGEATECVVREEYYGTPLVVALREGAFQLSRYYSEFEPEDEPAILEQLKAKVPAARKWVKRNRGLIEKAVRLQAR